MKSLDKMCDNAYEELEELSQIPRMSNTELERAHYLIEIINGIGDIGESEYSNTYKRPMDDDSMGDGYSRGYVRGYYRRGRR